MSQVPLHITQKRLSLDILGFRVFLIFLAAIIFFLIALLKSKSVNLGGGPAIIIYTMLVTTFELSRVLAAMFYKHDIQNRLSKKEERRKYEPRVTFVIPCKNEEKSIGKTITKSFQAHYPAAKLEVIVINDGSTDNTIGVLNSLKLKYPNLVVVDWKVNRGKRHGMVEGFRLAKGEIIVQLDSDSYITPHTFPELIKPFENPEIGAVCAHADPENAEENWITRMQAAYYFMSFRILKAAESIFFSVFCCSGCSSAYRKTVVMPIMDEWLNEKFLGLPVTWGDDRALTNWVIKRGYLTMYTDAARAFTICPNNLKQFLKQQVRWKKGWFVNSIFASKFLWKRQPFIAFTYFFPLMAVTFSTPFMVTRALIYNPLVKGFSPVFYVSGVLLMASFITIYYRWVSRKNKFWPYMFAWAGINMIILSFILFYALFTIQNRKWGTR